MFTTLRKCRTIIILLDSLQFGMLQWKDRKKRNIPDHVFGLALVMAI